MKNARFMDSSTRQTKMLRRVIRIWGYFLAALSWQSSSSSPYFQSFGERYGRHPFTIFLVGSWYVTILTFPSCNWLLNSRTLMAAWSVKGLFKLWLPSLVSPRFHGVLSLPLNFLEVSRSLPMLYSKRRLGLQYLVWDTSFVLTNTKSLLIVNPGSSARLLSSLVAPNASYDGSQVITVLAVEARNENA